MTVASHDTAKIVVAGSVIAILAAGWFVLSRWVMHNAVIDAVGEAMGVALALLVVVSVVGAVLSRDRGEPGGPDPAVGPPLLAGRVSGRPDTAGPTVRVPRR